MAVLCEKVLTEQDGVMSAIRIVDRIVHSAIGPEAPEQMPPAAFNLKALITLKSDAARGRHTIGLMLEDPSGAESPMGEQSVLFEGEDRGANVIADLALSLSHEGLHWIDVILDQETLLTRMSLRVIYQPQRTGTAGPPV